MKNNAYTGPWQTVTLACERRPDQITTLLEDWGNERQYYLNDARLSLEESLRVRDHSPAGFLHGYQGSGPSQLALAICLKLYPRQVAEVVYHFFKDDYIAGIPKDKEDFSVSLDVPTNPMSYWDLERILNWEHDEQGEEDQPSPEEIEENERVNVKNEQLQQRHDQAYQKAVELPGSIRYEFVGFDRFVSFCFLLILRDYKGKVLVLATDPGGRRSVDQADSGTSVTNAAEQLATQVCAEFKIPFAQLDWIERYVRTASIHRYQEGKDWNFEQTYDRIRFKERGGRLVGPSWQPVDKTEIDEIKNRVR